MVGEASAACGEAEIVGGGSTTMSAPAFGVGVTGPSRTDETFETLLMLARKVFDALGYTEMSVFSQDCDLQYSWVYNAGESWLSRAKPGTVDIELLSPTAAERSTRMKKEVIRTTLPSRFELAAAIGSTTRWYDIRLNVDRDENGKVCGILGTCIEITEQKRREETLKTLLRELSHRSKNLLAIIQSLASQTARHSVTVPEFLVRFRGRIQSLAYSQDIVTDTDWRGADFIGLVTTQVERYAPDGMEQVVIEAPDVYLSPTASLHVGLALHELAVNAASYGSLSVPGGKILISGRLERGGDEAMLVLDWQERNGPRVRSERAPRFGTSTLEKIVPNAVGGRAELEHLSDGVRYRLFIPDTQFEVISHSGMPRG